MGRAEVRRAPGLAGVVTATGPQALGPRLGRSAPGHYPGLPTYDRYAASHVLPGPAHPRAMRGRAHARQWGPLEVGPRFGPMAFEADRPEERAARLHRAVRPRDPRVGAGGDRSHRSPDRSTVGKNFTKRLVKGALGLQQECGGKEVDASDSEGAATDRSSKRAVDTSFTIPGGPISSRHPPPQHSARRAWLALRFSEAPATTSTRRWQAARASSLNDLQPAPF
ncbi:MAG: hypothetical protein ACJAQ3_002738 [Planctomycetota bacterium]|jgi:hypothetical protein